MMSKIWQLAELEISLLSSAKLSRLGVCHLAKHRLMAFAVRVQSRLKDLARSASSPFQRRLTPARTAMYGTVTPKTWTSSCLSIAHASVILRPGSPNGSAKSSMLRTANLSQHQAAALVLQGAPRSGISAQMH